MMSLSSHATMNNRSLVAAVRVRPETIFSDIERLCEPVEVQGAPNSATTTIHPQGQHFLLIPPKEG